MPHPPEHKLRWYQYKLSSLFILTILVALASSWYFPKMHNAAKRRAAIAEIEESGGRVFYYDASDPATHGEPPGWFSWLRMLHGDEHLGNAVAVNLGVTMVTGSGQWFRPVNTQIADAELEHLKGLTNLRELDLTNMQISDAGLLHLKGLTNLRELNHYANMHITDAGLVHLEGLTKLKDLDLMFTQVTDEGVKKLKEALPNCEIFH